MIYQIDIPPDMAQIIRTLPPELKKSVKEALRDLSKNPHLGAPLRGSLKGLWKFRVRRYRIVFKIDSTAHILKIYAIGHRKTIYDVVETLI